MKIDRRFFMNINPIKTIRSHIAGNSIKVTVFRRDNAYGDDYYGVTKLCTIDNGAAIKIAWSDGGVIYAMEDVSRVEWENWVNTMQ